jgi:hypothetical protein
VSLNNGTLTILPAAPTVTWTNPSPIIYGTALSSVQLNAAASVPGALTYIPTNGTVLDAGTNTISVSFAPNDNIDYTSALGSVSLVVLPAPLTVTAANATRAYGQPNPVFTGTLTGATNGDNITAAYTCSATPASPPGTYAIVPSLVDPNNRRTNYFVSLLTGVLAIVPAAPAVTWSYPAPIIYGTPLGSAQLNASANVPGSLSYTPTNGTVLNAGINMLSVNFTPADTVDYTNAIASVSLVVMPAPLTVTAANATRAYGQPNPVFTGTLTGVTNGDNITAAYTCSATPSSPAGTYPIVPSLADPNNRQTNYTVSLIDGMLTVTGAAPLTLLSVTLAGDTITLAWTAEQGQNFQVQYTTNLASADWTNWLTLTATNSTAAVSDVLDFSSPRFYRTLWVP